MEKELRKYIKECNDVLIQNGWEPKVGDRVCYDGTRRTVTALIINTDETIFALQIVPHYYEHRSSCVNLKLCIFLPSLDQLLDILGERLSHLALYKKVYRCVLNGKVVALRDLIYNGSTRKLACLLAVKEVLKEDAQEERDLVMQTRPFVKRALKKEENND